MKLYVKASEDFSDNRSLLDDYDRESYRWDSAQFMGRTSAGDWFVVEKIWDDDYPYFVTCLVCVDTDGEITIDSTRKTLYFDDNFTHNIKRDWEILEKFYHDDISKRDNYPEED